MADYSVEEAMARIEALPDKVAKRGVEIMKVEVPIGMTGNMKANVRAESTGKWTREVGSRVDYAKYVIYGRGPVHASGFNHGLRWMGYEGRQTSVHHGDAGVLYARRTAGPAPENDYLTRTASALNAEHFTL